MYLAYKVKTLRKNNQESAATAMATHEDDGREFKTSLAVVMVDLLVHIYISCVEKLHCL